MADAPRRNAPAADGFFLNETDACPLNPCAHSITRSPNHPITSLSSFIERPAPSRRRYRQTLRRARIRPRTGVARPARGARADFVRANADAAGAAGQRVVATFVVAGDGRVVRPRCPIS